MWHCLVNRPTVTRSKDLEGLGVPNLDKLGRTLRLHLLWQDCVEDSKPWVGTEIPCNETVRLLFNASIVVTIENGRKARFWHHNWLEGEAPRNLTQNLFQLAKRKNKTVHQEQVENAWIRSLRDITSAIHVEEFISLWIRIQNVQLLPKVHDSII